MSGLETLTYRLIRVAPLVLVLVLAAMLLFLGGLIEVISSNYALGRSGAVSMGRVLTTLLSQIGGLFYGPSLLLGMAALIAAVRGMGKDGT